MLIRLRTKDGTKRLEVDAQQSLLDLRTQIEREYKIPVTQQKLSAEVRPIRSLYCGVRCRSDVSCCDRRVFNRMLPKPSETLQGRPPTELKSSDNGKTLNGLGLQHGDMLLLS